MLDVMGETSEGPGNRRPRVVRSASRPSGVVAHDILNLLTIVSGFSELSLAGLAQGHPLRENLEEISRAADQATDLARQLLS